MSLYCFLLSCVMCVKINKNLSYKNKRFELNFEIVHVESELAQHCIYPFTHIHTRTVEKAMEDISQSASGAVKGHTTVRGQLD